MKIVVIEGDGEPVVRDAASAMDLMATARYEYGADRVALAKEAVIDDFFILSRGIAGEILQKYINYGFKLAVFGDFSRYTSKPLRDFIRESNRGKDFFFVADREEAVKRLSEAI